MSQTEVNVNIDVTNGSEKFLKKKKNPATSGKVIIAVYASFVYVYISCTCLSRKSIRLLSVRLASG